ncbi:hypothetical protein LTR86_008662 [Recurvomyces mirabilis]|nr:hypothetical protein LTR86_008662 [Recurvomyces mirabilis]
MANNSSNNNITDERPFRFLDLPAELRLQIYNLHLQCPTLCGNPTPLVPDDPLLHTSKQIRLEALPIHEVHVRKNLLVEPCQRCTARRGCTTTCSSVLVRGDRLITKLSRARIATLPHIGKLFLSAARVAKLFRGEDKEKGTMTSVELWSFAGLGPSDTDAMDLAEERWRTMALGLWGLDFKLSIVRQRVVGLNEETGAGWTEADGNPTESRTNDTWFVQFE